MNVALSLPHTATKHTETQPVGTLSLLAIDPINRGQLSFHRPGGFRDIVGGWQDHWIRRGYVPMFKEDLSLADKVRQLIYMGIFALDDFVETQPDPRYFHRLCSRHKVEISRSTIMLLPETQTPEGVHFRQQFAKILKAEYGLVEVVDIVPVECELPTKKLLIGL